jgi:hypothetical protein
MNWLRLSTLVVLLITAIASATSVTPKDVDKSCKDHPQLVANCYQVRGRLDVYNGAPALRIWKIGTKRILGVSEQRFAVAGYRNVPEDILAKINPEKSLLGDFVVCPFTRQRKNEMQLVCIEKGTNLVVKDR